MTYAATRAEWDRARLLVSHILREPGSLLGRSVALLRASVLPQLDAALAMLDDEHRRRRWPLERLPPRRGRGRRARTRSRRVESHLRSGLAALT